MRVLDNPLRGKGLPSDEGMAEGEISLDMAGARALYARCPVAMETPLVSLDAVASELGIAALHAKDERQRMGLGSFKALGAAYALAKEAVAAGGEPETALAGRTYVSASAGNHGISLAAGAKLFGARAVVYLSNTVPESFAERLRGMGADVRRAGEDYAESLTAAMADGAAQGWHLLSDTSWEGYTKAPRDIMEGYLTMGGEAGEQMPEPPTHVFLQAGVGGMAIGGAASARLIWGDAVKLVVVEPDAAPALFASIEAGKPVLAPGPVSCMGRLDCKEPSHLALKYLARETDAFVLVSEDEGRAAAERLGAAGMPTTPSGAGGFAGLVGMPEAGMRAMIYVSEGPDD